MDLGALVGGRRPRPVAHQFLDGHPVVQDLAVASLHHLLVAQLQDVDLAAGAAAHQAVQTALLHELPSLALLPGARQVLLPLLLAPVPTVVVVVVAVVVVGLFWSY